MNRTQKTVLTMMIFTLGLFGAATARAANPNAAPATNDIPYQFVNESAGGPAVMGYITLTAQDGNTAQNYVSAELMAGTSKIGKLAMPQATMYSIAAKGFITTGAGINCGSTQYLQVPNGRWDKKKQVVAVYSHAEDAALFSCTLTVISR